MHPSICLHIGTLHILNIYIYIYVYLYMNWEAQVTRPEVPRIFQEPLAASLVTFDVDCLMKVVAMLKTLLSLVVAWYLISALSQESILLAPTCHHLQVNAALKAHRVIQHYFLDAKVGENSCIIVDFRRFHLPKHVNKENNACASTGISTRVTWFKHKHIHWIATSSKNSERPHLYN